jgi:hypothetical protein
MPSREFGSVSRAASLCSRNWPQRREETEPKSGKPRAVPLWDQAAVALDRLPQLERFTSDDARVFVTDTGEAIGYDVTRGRFEAARDRAGLTTPRASGSALTFHCLKHSYGTLAARIYADLRERSTWATRRLRRRRSTPISSRAETPLTAVRPAWRCCSQASRKPFLMGERLARRVPNLFLSVIVGCSSNHRHIVISGAFLVPPAGLEPATVGLKVRCSTS